MLGTAWWLVRPWLEYLQPGKACKHQLNGLVCSSQLYLNYRMKSVAHLPWRQMTYKFLNTIIDDLFAFVIKMPTLHRLSVFRDDIVFLIYIYQRWIYRVDKKRANEFGCASPLHCMPNFSQMYWQGGPGVKTAEAVCDLIRANCCTDSFPIGLGFPAVHALIQYGGITEKDFTCWSTSVKPLSDGLLCTGSQRSQMQQSR